MTTLLSRLLFALVVIMCVGGIGFTAWAAFTGRIPAGAATNPNTRPSNVEHSPLAVEKMRTCWGEATYDTSDSRARFYPDQMIECLYAVGITLEYNGEPVRRERTPNS